MHGNYNVLNSNELFNTLNSLCCQERWRILLRLSKIRFLSLHYNKDTTCNNRGQLVGTQPVTEDVMSDFWSLWGKKTKFQKEISMVIVFSLPWQFFVIPFSKYLLKDNIVEKNFLANIQKMASFHFYFIIMTQFSWCLLFYSFF